MKPDPVYKQLKEAAWRGRLTSTEETQLRALLAANPQAQADWESEFAMSEALLRLPDAEVPSNFTARVLVRAVQEERAGSRSGAKARLGWLRGWLPRVATLGLVALLSGYTFSYHFFQTAKRKELARSLVTVSDVSSLPSAEVLQDYDAIQALKLSPPPDMALLALLK